MRYLVLSLSKVIDIITYNVDQDELDDIYSEDSVLIILNHNLAQIYQYRDIFEGNQELINEYEDFVKNTKHKVTINENVIKIGLAFLCFAKTQDEFVEINGECVEQIFFEFIYTKLQNKKYKYLDKNSKTLNKIYQKFEPNLGNIFKE
jgi:hypothetical protein